MRYNYLKESGLALQEIAEASNERQTSKLNAFLKEMNEKAEEIQDLREYANFERKRNYDYKTKVLTEMLSTALKAIYITAMENCNDMSKGDYMVCESLVDKYIEEAGGARMVLENMKGKTYLLDTIKRIVEEAEEEVEDSVDDTDKEVNKVPDEPKEKMFDKLENEEDVDSAVELIANRISNAEEEFIKKNAEDKEKIEKIITDINNRIDAVKKDNSIPEETKEEIKQEQSIISKRKVNEVYERRTHNVFETMVHEISTAAMKDKKMKEIYTVEDGSLNMDKIVGSVKCLYGFLEFVNLTQLEKIDESYIEKVLSEI